MHFISASNEISKIIFNPQEETLALGDFIKFSIGYNRFVVSLVNKIKTIKENDKFNLAIARSFLTLDEDIVENWNGQIPAPKTKVEKMPLNEILGLIKSPSKSVLIGNNNQDQVYSSVENLKQNSFIFADNQQDKIEFVKSLSSELLKNNQKIIIFDFLGEFSFKGAYSKIVAGKDFKLLLNAKTIDAIYEQGLKDALIETRAVIEDIFAEIKNYLKEDENNFIPFNNFKEVISSEKSVPQLTVLKNQLDKYQDQNIFANSKAEFEILKEKLKQESFVVVDLSCVSSIWAKEFLQGSFDLNFGSSVFCFFDLKDGIVEEKFVYELIKHKEEKEIYPIFSIEYANRLAEQAGYLSQNLFLFSPNIFLKQFPEYSMLLSGLGKNEFLAILQESGDIPFKLAIKEESEFIKTFESESKEDLDEVPEITLDNIFEAPSSIEYQPKTKEIQESELEIEEDNNDEIMQETQDVIEYNQAEEFDFDELDLDEIEEDDDEIDIPQRGQTEIYNQVAVDEDDDFELIQEDEDDIADEISDEVESLYTAPKNDDFSNNSLPIYKTPQEDSKPVNDIKEGDDVSHQKYGIGVVKKIIKYGEKTLLSIQFDKAGRRLLDPNLAELEKINA